MFIDCPAADDEQRNRWKDVARDFKEYQRRNLDQAAYMLLRNIELHMVKEGITMAHFEKVEEFFTMCLWALIQLPIPMRNPKKPKRWVRNVS